VKSLLIWAGGPVAAARRCAGAGGTVVAWTDDAAAALGRAGVPCRAAALDAEEADAVDEAAIAWTKAWGKRPVLDGQSVRDLLAWKGVSLWWFAELYLHYSTRAPRHVRLIERFHRLLEAERPDEVEAAGLPSEELFLLERTCTARGLLFLGRRQGGGLGPRWATLRTSLTSRWNTLKAAASALKTMLAGAPPRPGADGRKTVLFLSHAAFWRERRDLETDALREYEHYFDRLIPEVGRDQGLQPYVVAVGPRAAFRRRGAKERLADWARLGAASASYVHVNAFTRWRVFRETLRATGTIRGVWRRLRHSPGVHESFAHRGVSFAELSGPALAGTMLLQLPWAVRSCEEMAEVLAAVAPGVLCLYAESSGWGRAALAACRAAGVASLAVQHGIIYPKYYSYLHPPDEGDCPRPDRTALFGEAAQRILLERGGYRPETLVLTGSPKFDELLRAARQWDREALRRRLGVALEERLVVVASRYRGIRETHQSIGSAFAGLVRAIEAREGVRGLVKPHPAEPPDAYAADLRSLAARRVQLLRPGTDLLELLHAADVVVTVESLSAVEALVLSRPVLILNMPTNLRELVEHGAALGVPCGDDPAPALEAVLFDPATRDSLARARERYLSYVACGVDGHATQRILDLVRETAAAGMIGC
jgi:hypothetical protein